MTTSARPSGPWPPRVTVPTASWVGVANAFGSAASAVTVWKVFPPLFAPVKTTAAEWPASRIAIGVLVLELPVVSVCGAPGASAPAAQNAAPASPLLFVHAISASPAALTASSRSFSAPVAISL